VDILQAGLHNGGCTVLSYTSVGMVHSPQNDDSESVGNSPFCSARLNVYVYMCVVCPVCGSVS